MKKATASAALGGLLVLASCAPKPPAPGVPALPPAMVAAPPAPQAPPATVEAPAIDAPSVNPADLPAPPGAVRGQSPAPPPQTRRAARPKPAPKPARAVKQPSEPRPAAVPEAKPPAPSRPQPAEEPAAEPGDSRAPVLGEVLTPDQRNRMFRELESNLAEARTRTSEFLKRRPEAGQDETVTRIRSFIGQADRLRTSDLPTALSLSRRALTLARELNTAAIR